MAPEACDATTKDDNVHQKPSTAACAAVLGTYELLEQILSSLSLHDLFVLQRIAQNWQHIIRRSALLRKKMFLVADGIPQPPRYDQNGQLMYRATPMLNPAAAIRTMRHQQAPFGFTGHSNRVTGSTQFAGTTVNEIFARPGDIGITINPLADSDPSSEHQPSWRDMLVMRPPATAMDVKISWGYNWKGAWDDYLPDEDDDGEDMQIDDDERYGTCEAAVYNPKGLTFGDLQDIAVHLRQQALKFPIGSGEFSSSTSQYRAPPPAVATEFRTSSRHATRWKRTRSFAIV